MIVMYVYRIAQNFGGGKPWRIDRYRVFGEENVGEFTIATISYSSEPGIWLGKTLANDVRFAKFAKVFTRQSFALYGISQRQIVCLILIKYKTYKRMDVFYKTH